MNENLKCMLQAFGFWSFAAFFVSLIATIVIHPESIVGICLSFTFLIISVVLFLINFKSKAYEHKQLFTNRKGI